MATRQATPTKGEIVTSNEQYPGSNQPFQPPVPPTGPQMPSAPHTPGSAPVDPAAPTADGVRDASVTDPTSARPASTSPAPPGPAQPEQPSYPAPGATGFPAAPSTTPGAYPAPGVGGGYPAPGPSGAYPTPGAYPPPGQAFPPPAGAYPGAPGGPSGFPAPGSQPPGQQPPGAAYPFTTAGQPPQPPKKGNKAVLIIGAAVLALIVIVSVTVAMFKAVPVPGQASSAKDAVSGYLEALAASDASAAIDYGTAAPSDTSLLTDEMLQASNQRAPITDIAVSADAGADTSVVSASYKIGGEPVSAQYEVEKVGDRWLLSETANEVSFIGVDPIDATINGMPVRLGTDMTLFPGSYVLASTNDRLEITGGTFLVSSPGDYVGPSIDLKISDKGVSDARTAAQSLLDSCLKQNKLAPTGCGFGVRASGVKVKTVQWRITSGANEIKKADFSLGISDPYVSKVYVYIGLGVKVTDTAGRRYTGSASISTITVDLSGTEAKATFD